MRLALHCVGVDQCVACCIQLALSDAVEPGLQSMAHGPDPARQVLQSGPLCSLKIN